MEAAPREGRHVLHDCVTGSKLAQHSSELGPKSRARSVEALAFVREREVLAGEATAHHVDRREAVRPHASHVVEALRLGPVALEDGAAVGVLLYLPEDGADPGGLEP